MRKFRNIISGVIWTLVGLYVTLIVLLHIPAVQSFIGTKAGEILSEKFDTKVSVGRVDIGFLNRLIVDDLQMFDQNQRPLLKASRASVKIDLLELAKGKISILSAQLFGLDANLYKESADASPNFQFVLDSLASKDQSEKTPINLKISSLIIRNGKVAYNRLDIPRSNSFSPDHINTSNISAHIILNTLQEDSINVNVKKLSFIEASGLRLSGLSMKLFGNDRHLVLEETSLRMPKTNITLSDFVADIQTDETKRKVVSVEYKGNIKPSTITLSDLKCFEPSLENFKSPISFEAILNGTDKSTMIESLNIRSADGNVALSANGAVSDWNRLDWGANILDFYASSEGIANVIDNFGARFKLPEEVRRLGNVGFKGSFYGNNNELGVTGLIKTNAGSADFTYQKNGNKFVGNIQTDELNLKQILNDDKFGTIATNLHVNGLVADGKYSGIKAKGKVSKFDYNSYMFNNIELDGSFDNNIYNGLLRIDDPNIKLNLQGSINISGKENVANLMAEVRNFNPSALKLSNQWPETAFSFNIDADISGRSLNKSKGEVVVSDFLMDSPKQQYYLEQLNIRADENNGVHLLDIESDFARVSIVGDYDYETLPQSFINIIGKRLPTLPGLPDVTNTNSNDFIIDATLNNTDWLKAFFNIPLDLKSPLHIEGDINDANSSMNMNVVVPDFVYDDTNFKATNINISTPNDTLRMKARIDKYNDMGQLTSLMLSTDAINDKFNANTKFSIDGMVTLKGNLDLYAKFYQDDNGADAAYVSIQPSELVVNDTIWMVEPSSVIYKKDNITVYDFAISHDHQFIHVDGKASKSINDSLFVDLNGIDISYILDIVDFHPVEFDGYASGRAFVAAALDKIEAAADLRVDQFRFENGRMGTLYANALLNNVSEQIDIDAVAIDEGDTKTVVQGYVSPKNDYIDLHILPHNTRLEFIENFCGSFMDNVTARGSGELRLFGPLSTINLTGKIVANGDMNITTLNTVYTLHNDTVRFIPDEIIFENDTIYDQEGHYGIFSGSLYHDALTNLRYNLNVDAHNLLAFDFKDFDGSTFCGTVYGTGICGIQGKSGEVNIDVNITPNKDSQIIYNASSPDDISTQEFIRWNEISKDSLGRGSHRVSTEMLADTYWSNASSDIHINFLINTTPEATLKVLMDEQSGDYIALNGNGIIRASYYNKGAFQMFGNYLVDHGVYKLTIQNIIKKDFQFEQGGTIVFGGNPYDATLNLKAIYTVNGVPLSDLNIGNSFTSNNIRVNCLMNIIGTPKQPSVDFDLDMPTVGSDAKQMIFSIINSEEEMNQQVLYLLAVGRFLNQGTNNANAESASLENQTSLAMQSILSGTISQQLNNVLSSVIKNNNWNFGANISTGNEGFNNAEYEGLLSGRLLNNRLLFNGQFGYRDNPNATTSFIGDFDIRYLLYPNGNLAIKVYNQTNDRYFTRNSLNTQGVGLIMKKDFNGLKDLFGIRPKKERIKKNNKED